MIRIIPVACVALIAFAAIFALSVFVVGAGLVPDDAVTLWASAITAGDGEMSIGRIVAAYPTIPFFATSLLNFVTPAGTSTPILLTASLVACLAGAWLVSFRRAGLPLLAAAAAALVLALHPALLRAAIAGPADTFLAAFMFLLGGALYDLRARSGAPEVMAVALSLVGLAFSHPMGAALACAATPFLVFAVRPELIARSAFNVVIALIFPTAFCVFAFSYISWVFPGSGWSFLVAPAEGVANWSAGFSRLFGPELSGWPILDAAFAATLAFTLGAPLVPVALAWVRRRRPLVVPAVLIVLMTVTAACVTVATGLFGDPAAIAVVPPILAATIITRVPGIRDRLAPVMALLVMGWLGGIAGLALVDPRGAANVRAAIEGRGVDLERLAAIGLGHATAGRDGIMVDIFNAPAVVLGRGGARGLLSPSDETFTIGLAFSRIETPFVAVPDPQIGNGAQDRVNKAFPLIYRSGTPGYHLVYENASWRLFARN